MNLRTKLETEQKRIELKQEKETKTEAYMLDDFKGPVDEDNPLQ